MVWGNTGNRAALDGWLQRLRTNDARFVSLHVLQSRHLTAGEFSELFAALRDNRTLQQLHCAGHAQSDEALEALAMSLEHNTTLHTLTLGDPELATHAPQGFAALCAAIARNTALRKLDLDFCGLGTTASTAAEPKDDDATATTPNGIIPDSDAGHVREAADALRLMLTGNRHLQQLMLSRNALTDGAMALITAGIGEHLQAGGALYHLDVGYNRLGQASAAALARLLTINTSTGGQKCGLRELIVSGNEEIGEDGAAVLARAAAQRCSPLRQLSLADLLPGAATHDDEQVETLEATQHVHTGDAFLRAFVEAALAPDTKDNAADDATGVEEEGLRTLRLDRSGVSDAGAAALGRWLWCEGCPLREVALRNSRITETGAAQLMLGHAGRSATAPLQLDLSANQLADAGLQSLLLAAEYSLTSLVLFSNNITLSDTSVPLPEAAAAKFDQLTRLDLSANYIDTDGFTRLADWLIAGALPALTILEMGGNIDVQADAAKSQDWETIAARVTGARPNLALFWR